MALDKYNKLISELHDEHKYITNYLRDIRRKKKKLKRNNYPKDELKIILKGYDKELEELEDEIEAFTGRLVDNAMEQESLRAEYDICTKVKEVKNTFIMGCPRDECRGFLSSSWKCGTCNEYTCSKCRIPKNGRDDPDHVCKEDDLATANLLKNDTKPCPKCAIPIYKIMGCDQMYCVSCYTAFSWNTGKIETGTIHNPHYYEMQRALNNGVAPRVPGDVPCGGLPHLYHALYNKAVRMNILVNIVRAYRSVGHIENVEMPRFDFRMDQNTNENLRVSYLLKEINHEQWFSRLKAVQKKSEKNTEIHDVFGAFVASVTDILQRFHQEEVPDVVVELETCRSYLNKCMFDISRRYKNKTPRLDQNWFFR